MSGLLTTLLALSALATQPAPAFEVASVRQNTSGRSESTFVTPADTLAATNYELRLLIARAYGIPFDLLGHKLIGGPAALLETRFDVQAKAPPGTSAAQIPLMLRALLAERFRFRVRSETRETPVYALTVETPDVFGPEFRPSTVNCAAELATLRSLGKTPIDGFESPRDARNRPVCCSRPGEEPRRKGWQIRSAGEIQALVAATQGFLDRPIVDATGLTGNFEWQLEFSPLPIHLVPVDSAVPSLLTAFEEQLGLRLQPTEMSFEVFVVESLEFPSPN